MSSISVLNFVATCILHTFFSFNWTRQQKKEYTSLYIILDEQENRVPLISP